MGKQTRHDTGVIELYNSLDNVFAKWYNVEYNNIDISQSLGHVSNPIGEIDDGYYKKGYEKNIVGIYEFKCTYNELNYKKAIEQLKRAEEVFIPLFCQIYRTTVDEVRKYFSWFEKNKLRVERIN